MNAATPHLFTAKFFVRLCGVCVFISNKFINIGKRWNERATWCHQQADFHIGRAEKEIKRLESELL